MLIADVSEHSVSSIVIGGVQEDETECSETSTHNIQALGNHPTERIHYPSLFVVVFDFRYSWYDVPVM